MACPFPAHAGDAREGAAAAPGTGGLPSWHPSTSRTSSSGSSSSSGGDSSGGWGGGGGGSPFKGDAGRCPMSAFGSSSSLDSSSSDFDAAALSADASPRAAAPPHPPPAPGVHQAWVAQRPDAAAAPRLALTRRQLRRLGRSWALSEVARHKSPGDAWIAVNGRVYDITEHIASHPGWEGAGITTVLSIIAHLGCDCSAEFAEIHRPWPAAWRQLAAFDIGPLAAEE